MCIYIYNLYPNIYKMSVYRYFIVPPLSKKQLCPSQVEAMVSHAWDLIKQKDGFQLERMGFMGKS